MLLLLLIGVQLCIFKIIKDFICRDNTVVIDENPDKRFNEQGEFKDKTASQTEESGYVMADIMKSFQDLMSEE
jgi:hypothetical protein